ncbi:hypothetical protein Tco_1138800 [Tanacetum coccineum]
MAELILNEARAEQNLVKPCIESDVKYKLGKELLNKLHYNAYNGRVEEDVVGYIAKILEILDLIKIVDVNPFQLRMKIFPLLLSEDARKWWMNEGDGKINIWEELVKQFFSKFYPLSCASNYNKMYDDDEEGRDPLKFITWRNSKFKDHKKVDEMTKRALLYSWIEVGNNEGIMDEGVSSDDNRNHTNLSMIVKPEIKIGDEFLKILHDNSFNGVDGSDVTDHITKVLEITEWIKIPNVIKDELRLHVFSKSLSGYAEKWWNSEGTATTWRNWAINSSINITHCRDYSSIPILAHHDIRNPDELCQTDEFTIIRYLTGSCKEFITEPYGDLAIRKSTIWYTLKKTCVELMRAF